MGDGEVFVPESHVHRTPGVDKEISRLFILFGRVFVGRVRGWLLRSCPGLQVTPSPFSADGASATFFDMVVVSEEIGWLLLVYCPER